MAKQMTTQDKPRGASEVATREQQPDFMKGMGGMGIENLDSQDYEVPRIQLLQALSPELEQFNEARRGEFWHVLAERSMGTEVRSTFVYVDKRYILWRPKKTGGGILARADDGVHWAPPNAEFEVQLPAGNSTKLVRWKTADTVAKSGLHAWGTSDPDEPNSPPAATGMYCLVSMFEDFPDLSPAVVTLQRSAYKVGRRLLSKIKIANAPMFGLRFVMKSFKDAGPSGDFLNYYFQPNGFVQDRELFNHYQSMYELFKKSGVKVRDIEKADDLPDDVKGRGEAKSAEGDDDF